MGKPTGFMEYERESTPLRPVEERIKDWNLIYAHLPQERIETQAARCMDCGVPFCNSGCPLGNVIPDWNDLVYRDRWQEALTRLHSTNNFPEFTGLVCPAPCEASCVLNINSSPVTIKQIEWAIIDRGFKEGWVKPRLPASETGRSVGVVGSGPAGLSAAQQLRRAGHAVTVYEKADAIGGLLRYGIPDFKLEKWIIDRRLEQMSTEGVLFQTGVEVGNTLSVSELRTRHDAVLLACGSEYPRDIQLEGRHLDGIMFAMDFLVPQNRRVSKLPNTPAITAKGKRVVILGGGDTGSDCLGTSHRQGALSVTQLELMERPPDDRDPSTPWPMWPLKMRTSSSQEEGGSRDFGVMTQGFSGSHGHVERLHAVRVTVEEEPKTGQRRMVEVPGSEFEIPCDLVLLAIGYAHPTHEGLLSDLGVALTSRGNVKAGTQTFETSTPGVFAAGDIRRGQSLVVWAQWEGREAARAIDRYLVGQPRLPSRDTIL
ncbi:MAG: glutamate synthase subunit beta [Myxococcota bacterium]